uniref:CCHC-type domain-containing protein n=1 Tax=Panagrolaimus davidi TaxID=227884 RepID=A0A914PSD3_9BILA
MQSAIGKLINVPNKEFEDKICSVQGQRKFEKTLKMLSKVNKPTAGNISQKEPISLLTFEPPTFPSVNMLATSNWLNSIQPYDGNPEVDFDEWIRRFSDLLQVLDNTLDDVGKVNKLKCFLAGPAREKFEEVIETATNFQQVAAGLKKAFESPSNRSLASAKLSAMDKKMPQEDLEVFIKRFEKLVKQATAGLGDAVVKQKMLDEFLLKLDPELAFHVRNAEPNSYQEAVSVARKHDVLLKIKTCQTPESNLAVVQTDSATSYHGIDVNKLAEQIALNLQLGNDDQYDEDDQEYQDDNDNSTYDDDYDNGEPQNENDGYSDSSQFYDSRICYFCGEQGHIQRDCQDRLMQEEQQNEECYQ